MDDDLWCIFILIAILIVYLIYFPVQIAERTCESVIFETKCLEKTTFNNFHVARVARERSTV